MSQICPALDLPPTRISMQSVSTSLLDKLELIGRRIAGGSNKPAVLLRQYSGFSSELNDWRRHDGLSTRAAPRAFCSRIPPVRFLAGSQELSLPLSLVC